MSSIFGKFSKFQSQYDKPCMGGCGRALKKGDMVYGTKDPEYSPKGRWFIVCPDCYARMVSEGLCGGAGGESKPSPRKGDAISEAISEGEDLLREFIALEAEKEQTRALERKQRRVAQKEAELQAQREREERKNIPWTLEWLWEHAEWRWNKKAEGAR